MKSTAVYLRVSSKQQDAASQEPDVTRYLAAHDMTATTYRDKFTGKSMSRPGFDKLLAAIRAGRVDTVIVWRLDRLGRTSAGLTALFEELVDRKVNLVSLKDGFDLSTTTGRMIAGVLASLAQWETEMRAERVLAGLAVAKANGVRLGRPAGVHTRVKVTDEQAAQIAALKTSGETVAAIARATGLSRPTVYSILAA